MKKVIKRKPNKKNTTRRKKTTLKKPALILFALMVLIILILSYIFLGGPITLLVAIGISIIYGLWFLLIREKHGKKRKKIVSIILILFLLCGIAALIAFSVFIVYVKSIADPKFTVENLNTLEISRIYDKDGNEIAKLGSEKREKVTYDQLPEVLVDAIIATEDSRFFQHNGFDAPRFLRATIGQVIGNSGAGGASTLSMQVTKNSFTDPHGQYTSGKKGIIRKFEDIYLTIFKLEKTYSKEQIIEYYVNNHFLGGNIYGVQEASNAYFGKNVSELNLSEAAIIAGMFKSPNYYRPTVNPKNAEARRKTVLYYMRKAGYITKSEEDIANSIPVESLTSSSASSDENPYQGYIDTVVDEVIDKYGVNPYDTPLLVYTNLDLGRQNAINQVFNGETYNWINDKVQGAAAVVDTHTGKILAIGNGRNNINGRNNSTADQYNYAVTLKRQPGSTAKPLFDYGPGIEYNNWSTYELFNDAPYTYSGGQPIHNWDGGYFGVVTLRRALAASRNIPALKAFQSVDNNKIAEFVTNLGIIPEICPSGYKYNQKNNNCYNPKDSSDVTETIRLHEAHSIGAFTGVSPLQMAGAYAAFSNGGVYNEPYAVEKIVFRQSKETVEHNKENYVIDRRVMSDATAFMISSVLQDVQLTGGTPANVACKTGTTNYDAATIAQNNMPADAVRDSWVIGYSTNTVIGMWYGYDYIDPNGVYVLRTTPATIQKDRLFNAIVASGAMEANRSPFEQPASVATVRVSPGSNPPKLAAPGTGIAELFKKGTEPTEYDVSTYHIDAPGNLSVTPSGNKVTLNWSPTSPGVIGNEAHGTFGYNVYKDNVLITWTDKTTYSFTPSDSIYGTYKIIATYKSYNDIQSDPAIYILEEAPKPPVVPDEPKDPEDPGEEDPLTPTPTPVDPDPNKPTT